MLIVWALKHLLNTVEFVSKVQAKLTVIGNCWKYWCAFANLWNVLVIITNCTATQDTVEKCMRPPQMLAHKPLFLHPPSYCCQWFITACGVLLPFCWLHHLLVSLLVVVWCDVMSHLEPHGAVCSTYTRRREVSASQWLTHSHLYSSTNGYCC